ncbi:MAG: xanthine dehydrogenase family protein molybdopterin-binding subunit [Gemmataceae bacterium]
MSNSVGKPVSRVDGRAKVTGAARYAAEFPAGRMAYGFLVLSTVPKGRIEALDTKAADEAPGVLAVLTHKNAPRMKVTPVFDPSSPAPKSSATSAPILQTDEIFWAGQPVAVVVADTFERACHAASLVKVTYKQEKATFDLDAGRDKAFIPDKVNGEPAEVKIGDAEKALATAAVKVDHLYTTPREVHNAIEPHATTAQWDGDKLTVHDATQYVFGVREMLCERFSLKPEDVRVLSPFVGGGFGGKGLSWPNVWLAVAAARHVGRPVKVVVTREQLYGCTGYRTPTEQRVKLGADAAGKLVALVHTGVTTSSTTNVFAEQFTFPARHLYASPNIHLQQKVVKLDVPPPTFMRAPGESPGTFALESALDELAHAAGIDPVELRLTNDPANDPVSGKPFSLRKFREAYELGARKFGWSRRKAKPGTVRDGRFLVGMGVATAFYPVYQFPGAAKVVMLADGTAVVQSGTHEMGMGTATVQAQHAADLLDLPVEKVRFEYGDTNLPFAAVTGGSATTISVGAAVAAAVEALKTTLLGLAGKKSPLTGVTAGEVVFRDGRLVRREEPTKGEALGALARAARGGRAEAQVFHNPGKDDKLSKGSYGAQFCEVRVDPDLGEVRVTRFVGAYDCGKILNPKTARSQFIGGVVMGLGMALMEAAHTDPRDGRVVNANLAEYLIPTHLDVPALEAYWVDEPDPHTPMGAHGIGEIGITGVAAAVANAVFNATGKRVRDLPILPEKLL